MRLYSSAKFVSRATALRSTSTSRMPVVGSTSPNDRVLGAGGDVHADVARQREGPQECHAVRQITKALAEEQAGRERGERIAGPPCRLPVPPIVVSMPNERIVSCGALT